MGVNSGWTPEIALQWMRIFVSLLAAGVGAFMLVWQTVFVMTPNAMIIGAGLLALGVPPALRIDKVIANGHAKAQEEEKA